MPTPCSTSWERSQYSQRYSLWQNGYEPTGFAGLPGCKPAPARKKKPPWGGEIFGDRGKTHPPNPETRHKGLSSSPDFHELIGLFRVFHGGQQLLRLTMNAINELLVAVGDPVAIQDGFSQPAQDTSFDDAKPQPVDQQSSGFPDDFIPEEEVLWLEGMFGKIIFQL